MQLQQQDDTPKQPQHIRFTDDDDDDATNADATSLQLSQQSDVQSYSMQEDFDEPVEPEDAALRGTRIIIQNFCILVSNTYYCSQQVLGDSVFLVAMVFLQAAVL